MIVSRLNRTCFLFQVAWGECCQDLILNTIIAYVQLVYNQEINKWLVAFLQVEEEPEEPEDAAEEAEQDEEEVDADAEDSETQKVRSQV